MTDVFPLCLTTCQGKRRIVRVCTGRERKVCMYMYAAYIHTVCMYERVVDRYWRPHNCNIMLWFRPHSHSLLTHNNEFIVVALAYQLISYLACKLTLAGVSYSERCVCCSRKQMQFNLSLTGSCQEHAHNPSKTIT